MVAAEAFAMPTPHGTCFSHLRQLYSSFSLLSLCNLHNSSSVSLDGLTACNDLEKDSPVRDIQSVQSPHAAAVVRGSDRAYDKIVPQDWIYSAGQREMTESNVPLTARVACAG